MRNFMLAAKALGDENRVRLLAALDDRELCVCQLIELLGLAPSTVSKHLSILKSAQLVDSRKEGRWMYYRLSDEEVPPAVLGAQAWLLESLRNDPKVREDKKSLKGILQMDPEELCKKQCCR